VRRLRHNWFGRCGLLAFEADVLSYSPHRTGNSSHAGSQGGGMKAYLVLDLSVNDFGGFRKYIAEIPAFIAKHSGKYIVQGVQPTIIEGDWKPERVVIIEFPERKKAEAFLNDPEIQDLFKVRHDTTTSKLVLVDGCT
jgi:uncharacterized protein (DUF1330 family)